MKRLLVLMFAIIFLLVTSIGSLAAKDQEVFLVHLKTSLKKDAAQICVAYNVMWAALEEGKRVKVLIDANAINTYKMGWKRKDDIEEYKIPEKS